MAARGGHVECIAHLLRAKVAVDPKDAEGYTPLHVAAISGHTAAADALVRGGADGSNESRHGRTPSTMAYDFGYKQLAQKLAAVEANTKAAASAAKKKSVSRDCSGSGSDSSSRQPRQASAA